MSKISWASREQGREEGKCQIAGKEVFRKETDTELPFGMSFSKREDVVM